MGNDSIIGLRDRGFGALVIGFFASAWFGWGQASPPEPPAALITLLNIGTVLAICVAVAGAVVGFRAPRGSATLDDPRRARRYGIIVGIEFGLAGIGAGILGAIGQVAAIPVWICAVVGVHFFALAPVLRNRSIAHLGALVCAVAVAAGIVGLTTGVGPSAVTGAGAGTLLLMWGAAQLVTAYRDRALARTQSRSGNV